MSDIFCLVHVLCAVTYVRCSWHLFHSSVDLGDLARALFPILGESIIPQSSSSGRSCKYFSHVCSASLRCGRAALVRFVCTRSLSCSGAFTCFTWVAPSCRGVLACPPSARSVCLPIQFYGLRSASLCGTSNRSACLAPATQLGCCLGSASSGVCLRPSFILGFGLSTSWGGKSAQCY